MTRKYERHTAVVPDQDGDVDDMTRLEGLSMSWKPYRGLYPDRRYPLWEGFTSPDRNLTPEEWQLKHDGTETPTATRLREAFERAKERDGITMAAWAAKCSSHGRSGNVAHRWLASPSTMESDEVLRTCDLLGVSLEYLQGREMSQADMSLTVGRIVAELESVARSYESLGSRGRMDASGRLWAIEDEAWELWRAVAVNHGGRV